MIVRLQGRMANQLFQAAFGISVAKARGEELSFYSDTHTHLLAPFNVDIKLEQDTSKLALKFGERTKFDPEVYKVQNGLFFDGYFQNERFFDVPLVKEHMRFHNPPTSRHQVRDLAEEIENTESCFIHVRRGDYLKEPQASFHGVLGKDYYGPAINYIRERKPGVKFYVFSDDTNWCKTEFKQYTVVEYTNSYEDIFLMSKAKSSIVANSSYSWWAAWFEEFDGKLVVAPKQWFKTTSVDSSELVPERWISIG